MTELTPRSGRRPGGAGAGEVIAGVRAPDYSQPGKPGIDWGDPQAKESLVSDW